MHSSEYKENLKRQIEEQKVNTYNMLKLKNGHCISRWILCVIIYCMPEYSPAKTEESPNGISQFPKLSRFRKIFHG